MIIREATKDDFDQLLDLSFQLEVNHSELEGEKPNPDELKKKISRNLMKYMNEKTERFFVAEDGGHLVGFVDGEVSKSLSGIGWVGNLYVKPEFRKQGLGTKLMEKITQWLKNQGVKVVEFTVHEKNQEALSFYRNLGYQEAPNHYKVFKKEI